MFVSDIFTVIAFSHAFIVALYKKDKDNLFPKKSMSRMIPSLGFHYTRAIGKNYVFTIKFNKIHYPKENRIK